MKLPKELEDRKIDVVCPHCGVDILLRNLTWLTIFAQLDAFGKSVVDCPNCGRLFTIRDEDEDGPFITK